MRTSWLSYSHLWRLVLGLTLWNVAYDDLLMMIVPAEVQLIGFADVFTVVEVAWIGQVLEDLLNPALDHIGV